MPDYRLYRAELKGCILNLYKSGIGNAKFFDPTLESPINSIEQQQQLQQQQQQQQHGHGHQSSNNGSRSISNPEIANNVSIKYPSEIFPHPDLKCDKEGRVVFGTVESLCHAVLFAPLENDDTKRILNILLLLPLINDFGKFLVTFNLFGLTLSLIHI